MCGAGGERSGNNRTNSGSSRSSHHQSAHGAGRKSTGRAALAASRFFGFGVGGGFFGGGFGLDSTLEYPAGLTASAPEARDAAAAFWAAVFGCAGASATEDALDAAFVGRDGATSANHAPPSLGAVGSPAVGPARAVGTDGGTPSVPGPLPVEATGSVVTTRLLPVAAALGRVGTTGTGT